MKTFLLLPALDTTQTKISPTGNYSLLPPSGTYWYFDGEIIKILYFEDDGAIVVLRAIGRESVAGPHAPGFWEQVEVYEL